MNRIIQGDVLEKIKDLPDESVDCCITSPPYWGLRDYGVDGQLGLEKTPEEYVNNMVAVFREVKRVLKNDGTLWLNLGDSYANQKNGDTYSGFNDRYFGRKTDGGKQAKTVNNANVGKLHFGVLKPKNLVGIPWRVAFALQADGWYLRQDIIWHKPNPMPESVTDRCTKSHEYIFLLAKSRQYYFDSEAIKEKSSSEGSIHIHNPGNKADEYVKQGLVTGPAKDYITPDTRNKRDVWTVTTKPFKEAHFATFPEDLIVPMVKTTRPDAVILDPFFGAGTTGLVAKKLGRKYIGIELNPEYIKIAENRMCQDVLI